MESSEMLLFRKALWEASCNVYDRELAECGQEEIKCSRRHYAQMRKILGVAILPATNRNMQIKRRVVAALIAAALLLTGCTAYAYREKIRKFIETVFEDYIRISYRDTEEAMDAIAIEEYYTLGYVPEGYELVNEASKPAKTKYEWTNSEGAYITFEQCHVDSTLFLMDNEVEVWDVVKIRDREVYFRSPGLYCYVWNDGVYAYQLTTSVQWSEQELSRMIENIQVKE